MIPAFGQHGDSHGDADFARGISGKHPAARARNARTHSEEQIALIAASIAELGFTNPILIGVNNVIIAGHDRLRAAQMLELPEVPVIVLVHLSDAQRRALIIADNCTAKNSGWDEDLLRT